MPAIFMNPETWEFWFLGTWELATYQAAPAEWPYGHLVIWKYDFHPNPWLSQPIDVGKPKINKLQNMFYTVKKSSIHW